MDDPHILIVDDDPEITDALVRGLAMHGLTARIESTAAGAEARFAEGGVEAAIIDVMIGPDSGIALVERLRKEGHVTPILMLSALAEVEDRAAGLRAGADDYIVKPFAFDELVARLQVQRHRAAAPEVCILETGTRTVRSRQRAEPLSEREFALLGMLHARRGTVLSRGEIFDALWAREGTGSENVVDVYIGYLRRKLAPSSDFGFKIRTIRNRGFVLEPVTTE